MVRATAHTHHLLVVGTNLTEVTQFGAWLGADSSQLTLAVSPGPLARAANGTHDPSLVSVVLWHRGDAEFAESAPPRLLLVSLDGTVPKRLPCEAVVVSASEPPAVLQATITLLASRAVNGSPQ